MKNKPIYLDYNATTPVDPEVVKAMMPYLTNLFGNPSSNHVYGIEAKMAIAKAREQLASLINCKPCEIIFTSGGTESNNFALKGSAFHLKDKGNHIITSSIEHPAVSEVCQYLESHGFTITYLSVDKFGMISVKDLKKAINPKTILITIMHANNEIGTIQPIEEISKIAKKSHIRLHTDAAQSIGKVFVDVNKMQIDLLSIAGHKLYAPKGIGALYIREGTKLEKFMHGASHELNFRAGTENVSGIVGLGKAAEIAKRDFDKNFRHQKELKDYLYMKLKENIPEIQLNGHPEKCLPNTLSISFPGRHADNMLQKMEGIAASAGAACHSEGINISQTLRAIGLLPDLAQGTIRFSTGKNLGFNDIDKAIEIIIRTFNRIE
jgi:cysteine desulfurase